MTTRRSALAAALAGVLAVAGLAACGGSGEPAAVGEQVKKLRYQGNVGAVTLPELAADLGYLGDLELDWIGNTISGPQDIQAATTGDTDFGGAFNGAIVKLASSGAPITAVIGYYGVDDVNFNGFYVLELIVVPPVNTEQSLRAGQIDVAALGGTLRDKALERGGIHALYTDYDLLGKFTAGSYIFRDDFLRKNPDTVKTFVSGVGKAVEWSRTTPRDQVIAKLKEIIAERGREEDDSQTQFWKSYGVNGTGGVIEEREFATWIEWLDRAGELKKDIKATDIYSNDYNAYATGGAA
jgi:ABC-type nitrate/sulfonate/bicarbonate transport system substrate-binding protein